MMNLLNFQHRSKIMNSIIHIPFTVSNMNSGLSPETRHKPIHGVSSPASMRVEVSGESPELMPPSAGIMALINWSLISSSLAVKFTRQQCNSINILFHKYCLILFALLAPTLALADKPLTADHFAFSATLSAADNSLREVALPINILEQIQRRDFGDMRVFNAQGQEVPYQLEKVTTNSQLFERELNFYPFSREQASNPVDIRIQILRDSNNQTINMQSEQQRPPTDNEYQYIAENKNTAQFLCDLKLNWNQPKANMVLQIKIEGSNNLHNWSTLKASANLSMFEFAGSKLIHSRVSIACNKYKYLRLTWFKPEPGLKLNRISASYQQKGENVLQQKIIGKPNFGDDGNWYFKAPTIAPVTQLELVPPTNGLLYRGRLFSRPDDTSQWRLQHSISQYQLKISGTRLTSTPLALNFNNDVYWKIELDSSKQLSNDQLPDIRFGWRQQKLVFLAQGEAPFTLAYGNKQIEAGNNHGINDLIKAMRAAGEMPDKVTLGKIINNTNIAELEPEKTTQWRLIGLWFLLIFGTIVLGYMAYRLYQQMNE